MYHQNVYEAINEKKMPKTRQRHKQNSRILPQQSIDIMTTWYDKHYTNPYPTYRDCEIMASSGQITVNQVKQWFVNIRRRTGNQFRRKRNPYDTKSKGKEDSNDLIKDLESLIPSHPAFSTHNSLQSTNSYIPKAESQQVCHSPVYLSTPVRKYTTNSSSNCDNNYNSYGYDYNQTPYLYTTTYQAYSSNIYNSIYQYPEYNHQDNSLINSPVGSNLSSTINQYSPYGAYNQYSYGFTSPTAGIYNCDNYQHNSYLDMSQYSTSTNSSY